MKSAKRSPILVAGLALVVRLLYPAPPPRTLEGLAAMLGQSMGGVVLPSDIAWEPSPGVLAELLWGRRVLSWGELPKGLRVISIGPGCASRSKVVR